jgi:F-type H+-transporting ATPase subunit gamma
MAKTQDIKRRIRSISNTMQLTRAMKMVSAAKLRRAQEQILRARPYAQRTLNVLKSLSARANPELHPLLQVHGDKRVNLVVFTGDKGLCGSFNANVIRRGEHFARDLSGREISWTTVGKKGREYFARRGHEIRREWTEVFRNVRLSVASEIAAQIIEWYGSEEVDEVCLVYNEFKSAIQAKPTVQRLLPVENIELEEGQTADDYLYEPSPDRLFAALLPHYVEHLVFQALLESVAAEHAARMTAMDSATNNARDLIEALTLTMNRVRQASITTEIIEVVSGAQALG